MGTSLQLCSSEGGDFFAELRLESTLAYWPPPPASTFSTLSSSTQAQAMALTRLTLVAEHPTSTSADCTRGKLRLKLTPTLATTACPLPTTPATQAGLELALLASPL